ncbi:type IV pilus biogenesis protein PilM [Chengkuizengella axinellae]|uniref:Pilus assembly protein PilM n=1 Tax=Chengkuizengella axinellae TaxID=3064388 RepID=A0ABT9IXE1_9BACL|nr:pilus assembly protein PilM [Chengkuizengella sp. 2205SS18-9]MDP5274039.1 pilus assembly protein PilM [Chengkuizengella sp. 2205SS18-9]
MMKLIEYFKQKLNSIHCFLGLEITDDFIKLVEVKSDKENGFTIHQANMKPIHANLIKDGLIINLTGVIHILKTMVKEMNLTTNQVHFMLPSHLVHLHYVKVPYIRVDDIHKWIYEAMNSNRIILPFKESHYDIIKLNIDSNQNTEVILLTAQQDEIKVYVKALEAADLKPISMEIKALSLYRLIHVMEFIDTEKSFLIIEINEMVAEMSIFEKGTLQSIRVIPVKRSFQKYSSVRNSAKESVSFKMVDKNDDVFNYLIQEVKKFVHHYVYSINKGQEKFEYMIISGDIKELHEIGYAFNQMFPYEVKILEGNCLGVQDKDDLLPFFAVPLGLALRGRQ